KHSWFGFVRRYLSWAGVGHHLFSFCLLSFVRRVLDMLNRGIILIAVMLLTCVLASCGTAPSQSGRGSSTATSAAAEIQPLLEQARATTSPERERLILQAADLLVSQQDYDWARTLLTGLDPATLTDDAYVTYVDLLSEIGRASG